MIDKEPRARELGQLIKPKQKRRESPRENRGNETRRKREENAGGKKTPFQLWQRNADGGLRLMTFKCVKTTTPAQTQCKTTNNKTRTNIKSNKKQRKKEKGEYVI